MLHQSPSMKAFKKKRKNQKEKKLHKSRSAHLKKLKSKSKSPKKSVKSGNNNSPYKSDKDDPEYMRHVYLKQKRYFIFFYTLSQYILLMLHA